MRRPDYAEAVSRLDVMSILASFDPRIAGTLPLGLSKPESDIDILCHAFDVDAFAAAIWGAFSRERHFALRQWIAGERPIVASFEAYGWPFELFGHPSPVSSQAGWRHFDAERRLLTLGGADLQNAVMAARSRGLKTEEAFAVVLGLEGDPYCAMLDVADHDDQGLCSLLGRARYGRGRPG